MKSSDRKTYNEALEQYGQQHFREASQLLRRVAQHNPKSADPQFWLGMTAVRNGFNTTAIRKYFTKCIELCPDYPNALAHYYLGMIFYTDARYDEAMAEMEAYFRLANNSNDATQTAVYEEASAYLYWSRFLAEAVRNMAPFDPHILTGVSSKRNENLPFITPDGLHCYYLREMPLKRDGTSFYVSQMEKTRWTLFRSDWQDTAFSRGVELPAPFNSGDPEGGVSLTADGRMLFYSRIMTTAGYPNSDLYCGEWSEADKRWKVHPLENGINGDRTWESQPSVSADGQWLYFASNRKGGLGGIDLWRCHRLKNGDWSRPENLGPSVNTPGNEKFPFLHADGHTLYFVSDGWQGFGGYDIYFIDLAEAGAARPTNLGLPVNSEGDELSFGVIADGTRAYFPGRLASSHSTDILMFDLYPAARPEAMRLCRLKVEGSDTLMMLSEHKASTVVLSREGKLPFITSGKARELDGRRVVLADSVAQLAVTFADGMLTPWAESVLDAWAAWLFDHPRVHMAVECPKAAEAKTVYDFLMKKKLRAERLSYRGGTSIIHPQMRITTNH
ncbi:MAG: tetratricopeptide repeat protein [bacterium]